MDKPGALRLAEQLRQDGHECCDFTAASELERLHAENEALKADVRELVAALDGAANYIDALGGAKAGYRSLVTKHKERT